MTDVVARPAGRSGSAVEAPVEADGAVVPDQQLTKLATDLAQLARSVGREDLVARLEQTRGRLQDPQVRVIIVGQFKQGKSKLLNALVNAPVCPVDDDIATSVPTAVGWGAEPAATLIVRGEDDDTLERRAIAIDELAAFVTEHGAEDDGSRIVAAEVSLPRELLRGGLRLVDSPGVGGLESTRALNTLAALTTAHAVLLVSDAAQEYTEPEMAFLRHAMRISPNVAAVLSKTDIYPHWRQIEQIDRTHLGDVGEVPIFAVSSDLRMLAAEQQDRELNDESGFPALVAHLRRDVLGQAEAIHRRSAVHDLASVVDQLGMAASSELTALLHPEETPMLLAQLEDAKAKADEFRSRSSRWQVTLSDGIADLIADTEHDLRDRMRKVQREAEAAIDDGDPGPIWDQMTAWLDERIAAAVSDTFVWTNERAQFLSERVAEEFLDDESDIPLIEVGSTDGVLSTVEELGMVREGRMGAAEKIYIGVRGSYGGVLMAGLATSLVGLSLINPLSLLVGVLVGRRAYREDKANRLARRQAEAKNVVRRHIDDVVFQAGKQLKDRLRLVQRAGRDHFGGIADQLHRSLADAVLGAKQAAAAYSTDRDSRIKQLQAQIARVDAVRAAIPALPADPARPRVVAAAAAVT